ncbi:MAG: PilN domain-containing protein [Candidatus Omnitrophica bacterium]|nr:PilN domain-containing protein [Candidatus Omnitrophota bacterium]
MDKPKDILIIPRYQVTLRFIELPSVDSYEIANMVEFQALKELPYSKEEIITSFRNIGSYKKGFSYIMLAIVKKQLIEDIIKERKVVPENIMLGTEALYLYLLKKEIIKHDKASLVVDIHKDYSEIIIIDKTKPVFSRGFRNENGLMEEINRSLLSYKKDRTNKNIEEVFITYSSNLNIDNVRPHVEEYFSIPANFHEYKEDPNTLNFPFAIELLPGEYVDKRASKENMHQAFFTYFLLLVTAAMLASLFIFKMHEKNNLSAVLAKKDNEIRKDADQLNIFLKKTDIMKLQNSEGELIIGILKESYELVPGDIVLSELNYDGKDVLYYKGNTRDTPSVFNFIKILEKSKYFKKVEVKYATRKKVGDQELTDFSIACQVK